MPFGVGVLLVFGYLGGILVISLALLHVAKAIESLAILKPERPSAFVPQARMMYAWDRLYLYIFDGHHVTIWASSDGGGTWQILADGFRPR